MVERFQMKTEHDWICARLDEKGDWVRHSDYAALEAQLAEMAAENERLTKLLGDAQQALRNEIIAHGNTIRARTGAVKDAEAARDALRELANVKMDLSLEDWCRISNTILSAIASKGGER